MLLQQLLRNARLLLDEMCVPAELFHQDTFLFVAVDFYAFLRGSCVDYADRMTHLSATSDQKHSFGMNVFVTSAKDPHPTSIEPRTFNSQGFWFFANVQT